MVPARLKIRVDGPAAARTKLLSTESRNISRRSFSHRVGPSGGPRRSGRCVKEAKARVAETRAGGISGLKHAHSAGFDYQAFTHPSQSRRMDRRRDGLTD